MTDCYRGLSCEPIRGDWDKRPKPSLEDQINALTDMYKSLSIQVAAFHDHKLRQIDENRYVSKHFDKLDEEIKKLEKKINDHYEILKLIDFIYINDRNPHKYCSKCGNENAEGKHAIRKE